MLDTMLGSEHICRITYVSCKNSHIRECGRETGSLWTSCNIEWLNTMTKVSTALCKCKQMGLILFGGHLGTFFSVLIFQ